MYLLDTNVVSELRKMKSGKADAGVTAWAQAARSNLMFASVITLLEIETGILALERRDGVQAAVLRRWFETSVLPTFEKHTVPVDAQVARQCALFRAGVSCGLGDALIAATAHVHQMTVVTRNVRDFEPLGVRVLNPWAS